jgi:hypothetical protein
MVGSVRISPIGRVVEKGIASTKYGMALENCPRDEIGAAHHVNRKALGAQDELVLRSEDSAREVVSTIENARTPGAEDRVHHAANDRVQAVADHR